MIIDCPGCGMELNSISFQVCPKCDQSLLCNEPDRLLEIDVCHSGEDREDAREKILKGLDWALRGDFGGLKVIHGYGSRRGHTSFIRGEVRRFLREMARQKGYEYKEGQHNLGTSRLLFS